MPAMGVIRSTTPRSDCSLHKDFRAGRLRMILGSRPARDQTSWAGSSACGRVQRADVDTTSGLLSVHGGNEDSPLKAPNDHSHAAQSFRQPNTGTPCGTAPSATTVHDPTTLHQPEPQPAHRPRWGVGVPRVRGGHRRSPPAGDIPPRTKTEDFFGLQQGFSQVGEMRGCRMAVQAFGFRGAGVQQRIQGLTRRKPNTGGGGRCGGDRPGSGELRRRRPSRWSGAVASLIRSQTARR